MTGARARGSMALEFGRGDSLSTRNCILGIALSAALSGASGLAGEEPSPGPLVSTSEAVASTYPRHLPHKANFKPGEKLVYHIKWVGIPAGRTEFAVKWVEEKVGDEEADCLYVTCQTRSNAFSGFFYPVKTDVISLIDVEGTFSRQFDMDKNEGRYHSKENIRFDYERRRAEYVRFKPGPYRQKEQTAAVRLWDKVQDPLSCLYYMRHLDLRVGDEVSMVVNTAKRNWILQVNVLRREKLQTSAFGELDTLKIQPEVSFPGIFVRKGKMTIWLEEKTRIPVKMTVDVPVGSVTVTLASVENAPLRPSAGSAEAPAED